MQTRSTDAALRPLWTSVRESEVVILCLGEGVEMSGEAASRVDLRLPEQQRALAEAVLDLGRPVVAVLSSGRPAETLPWLFDRADAVLATWFLGSEAGNAVADVLTGKFNPSGRLALTWPRHVGQAPLYFAQRPTGRPTMQGVHYSSSYIDSPADPQFFFGHGCSFSRFELGDMRVAPRRLFEGDSFEVSIDVFNDSMVDGEATLFLFVRDVIASLARPLLELKGIQKISLAAKERGRLTWRLSTDDLKFVGPTLASILEPGLFKIHVGQSAEPAQLLVETLEVVSR